MESEILQTTVDKDTLPTTVSAAANELNRCVPYAPRVHPHGNAASESVTLLSQEVPQQERRSAACNIAACLLLIQQQAPEQCCLVMQAAVELPEQPGGDHHHRDA